MFLQIFFYYFRWGWLAEEIITFISEIITSDTVGASYAIIAEHTVTTVCEFMWIPAIIAFFWETQRIAVLTFKNTFTINTVFGIVPNLAVETILIVETIKTEVTILDIATIIGVSRIYIIEATIRWTRNSITELSPLLKETLVKIYILSVLHRVPCIRIPERFLVDWEWNFSRKHSNNFLSSFATFSFVKSILISKTEQCFSHFQRRNIQCWQTIFLPTKHRRYFI